MHAASTIHHGALMSMSMKNVFVFVCMYVCTLCIFVENEMELKYEGWGEGNGERDGTVGGKTIPILFLDWLPPRLPPSCCLPPPPYPLPPTPQPPWPNIQQSRQRPPRKMHPPFPLSTVSPWFCLCFRPGLSENAVIDSPGCILLIFPSSRIRCY